MLGKNIVIGVPNRERGAWPLYPSIDQSLDVSCLWEGELSRVKQLPLVEGGKCPEKESAVSHQEPTLQAAGG